MKRTTRRVSQVVVAFLLVAMFALVPSVEAFAQTGSFTVSAGQLNAVNFGLSGQSRTTSSVTNSSAQVTSIRIENVAISAQSGAFDLIIISPCNTRFEVPMSRGQSFPVTINNIPANVRAAGQWHVQIRNTGLAPAPSNAPVSTITSARMTVNWRV